MSTQAGSAPATTRNGFSHAELVELIARSPEDGKRHLWLIDAPFSLPVELLEAHGVDPKWEASIDWLRSFESPRQWRRQCRQVSRREPRRAIDQRFKTPMSPVNIRMFKQTWHCVVSVLRPLLPHEHVAILPMSLDKAGAVEQASVWLGEGCPSSLLRHHDQPHRGYKGSSESCRRQRKVLIDFLKQDQNVRIAEEADAQALADDEGDALDSLLLLASTRNFGLADHRAILESDTRALVEGWVYV